MRAFCGLLLALTGGLAATPALAQAAAPADANDAALMNAVFAARPLAVQPITDGGGFANPAYAGPAFAPASLSGQPTLVPGQGLMSWKVDEVSAAAPSGGAIDSLRLSIGSIAYAPGGVVTARSVALAQPDGQAVDLSYVRGWPAALSVSAGGYALDVSPHAGLGVNNAGGSAEAGAMVQLGARLKDEVADRLDRMGLHEVSADSFAGRGHWYLFAAASGRAVGLNMVGAFQRAGWSSEGASALIGDAQAGLGWRQGDVQAAFGYIHRAVREIAPIVTGPFNPNGFSDSMVAFSLTFRPR